MTLTFEGQGRVKATWVGGRMNLWMLINIHAKLQSNCPVVGGDISKTKTLTKTLRKTLTKTSAAAADAAADAA